MKGPQAKSLIIKNHRYFLAPTNERHDLLNVLDIPNLEAIDKYLGLPSLVGRARAKTFNFLCEKFKQRIDCWSSSFLSQAVKKCC